MKKIITKLLCGILLSSVMLCGCSQTADTTSSVTESQTEVTTTATEPAPVETTARPEINADNMK